MEQARFSRSFFRRRYLRRKKKYIRLKKMDTHFRLACRGVFILLHEGPFSILEICVKNGSEKNYISVSSLLDGTHGFEEYVRNLHSISFFPEIQKVPFNVFPMVFLGASPPSSADIGFGISFRIWPSTPPGSPGKRKRGRRYSGTPVCFNPALNLSFQVLSTEISWARNHKGKITPLLLGSSSLRSPLGNSSIPALETWK